MDEMMHQLMRRSLNLFVLFLGIFSSFASLGNTPENKSEQDIEVIQVYAQKRAQDIKDVSVAVTVVDVETANKLHLKDTTQLAALVPNVKMTNNAGEGTPPAFNIRGVGMIDYNTSTISPIAVYSDDIVGGSANNLSVNLFDLAQVEVLRGPQGTLFGRNTTGGAVLLRSQQPTDDLHGYVKASMGQNDHTSFDGALNLPLTDDTAVRFAYNREDYQFSVNNLMPGAPDGGLTQNNFRMIVKSDFDDVVVTAKVHAEDWSGKPKPIASQGVNRLDGSGLRCSPKDVVASKCADNFGVLVGGNDFWDVNADTADKKHDTDSWGASLKVAWQISDDISMNFISGYNDLERFHSWDSDGPGNFIEGSMGLDNQLFSQEINLAYKRDGLYWISGVYYLNEDIKQNNDIDLFRDFRAVPELAAIPAQFFYRNKLENASVALYSQIDYPLNDSMVVTAGLRYTDETTDYTAIADLDVVPAYIPELWNLNGKVEDDELSGKLALNHKIKPGFSTYYSYSRGYKSGGYNAGYTSTPEAALESEYAPETLDAFEVGTRVEFWQRDANLHLAAFYYDYKDQQVFVNLPSVPIGHVLKNAGDSTIYGLDAEFVYTPSHNLQFNFNVGYLPEANIGEHNADGVIVEDSRLPFSSKWNVSGYVLHEMDLAQGLLTTQLGFDYQSDFYFDQNENAYTQQDDYIVWHGRMTYQWQDNLEFSIWGKNLTDTEYDELRFDSIAALGAISNLKGESRQLGVEIGYSF